MTPHPYFVSPDAPLDEVLSEMVEHKYGAAVVMQNQKVVGMFTTIDAMRAFVELLQGRLASH
jgi:acetoin utilization protein AcuB